MPSTRIPNFKVALSDLKNGLPTVEWFTFFSYLFNLTGNGRLTKVLVAEATLDFPNTAAGACSDLTVTVTGAVSGDVVAIGVDSASVPANGSYFAWVSAYDTVTIRFIGPGDPASGTFKVTVTHF